MVVKLKDLKMLPPNHKIFKVPFFTVSHNTSEQKTEELKQSGFYSVSKALEQTAKIGKIEETFTGIRSKI